MNQDEIETPNPNLTPELGIDYLLTSADTDEAPNNHSRAFFVYMLSTLDGKYTYVGATVDLNRRLRQHNGEIKGGAKCTTRRGADQWKRIAYVSGFPSWVDALRFEWKWKYLTRKSPNKKGTSVERRMRALDVLVSLDRATATGTPYAQWASPPCVHIE